MADLFTGKKLTVDLENNVSIHAIEQNDDFREENLTEEERTHMVEANDKFDKEALIPALLQTFDVCKCQMQDFMNRNAQRQRLLNVPPQQFQPKVEQEDIDKMKFSVVLVIKNGIPEGISCIIKECKNCHRIEYYGRSEIFAQIIAEATVNWESAQRTSVVESTDDNPLGEDVAFEDLDAEIKLDDITEEETGV